MLNDRYMNEHVKAELNKAREMYSTLKHESISVYTYSDGCGVFNCHVKGGTIYGKEVNKWTLSCKSGFKGIPFHVKKSLQNIYPYI